MDGWIGGRREEGGEGYQMLNIRFLLLFSRYGCKLVGFKDWQVFYGRAFVERVRNGGRVERREEGRKSVFLT